LEAPQGKNERNEPESEGQKYRQNKGHLRTGRATELFFRMLSLQIIKIGISIKHVNLIWDRRESDAARENMWISLRQDQFGDIDAF